MRDLDWITDANLWVFNTAGTSGVFRITRLDHGGSRLLDTTPGTADGNSDALVVIGRT
jgi:hypothetical protein